MFNEQTYKFAKEKGLDLSTDIKKSPNFEKLRSLRQISQAEQTVMNYLRTIGYQVFQQVAFPSISLKCKKKTTVFVDAVVKAGNKGKEIIVEVDGVKWHSQVEDVMRDINRDEILLGLGYQVVRLPYEKPYFREDSLKNQEWWAEYLSQAEKTIRTNLKNIK